MKLAIVSLKGKSSEMIARAAASYFDKVSSFDLRNIRVDITRDGSAVMHEDKSLGDYDCVYLRGSFQYADLLTSIAIALKGKVYMPVDPDSYLISHNKFLTEVKLKEEGIPFPTTHLVYKTEMAKSLAQGFKYPVVFKTLSGTHGKGVMFADSIESANSLIDMLEKIKEPYLIQEFIETGASDIRAVAIGQNVISMMRTAKQGELRAGLHSGGEGKKLELSYEEKQIVKKVAKALKADIIAVDLLKGPTKVVVTEVNLSPGIVGLTAATKIDVADEIASFLHKRTREFIAEKEGNKYLFDLSGIGEGIGTGFENAKEHITNLVIKAGRIILPPSLTEASDFEPDERVKIKVEKDKIEVEKLHSSKSPERRRVRAKR